MSVGVKVKKDNIKKVKEAFPVAIRQGLEDAGDATVGWAQDKCPVDTGRLRASIESQMPEETRVEIGSAVEYGIFVETGTSRMSAKPFLKPAVTDHKDKIQNFIAKAIKEALDGAT